MAAAALGFFVASTAHGAVIANLEFNSLPSSQGWSYFEQGPGADGETNNYTATGSTLELRRFGGGMQLTISNSPIPEPSSLVLLAMATLALLGRRSPDARS